MQKTVYLSLEKKAFPKSTGSERAGDIVSKLSETTWDLMDLSTHFTSQFSVYSGPRGRLLFPHLPPAAAQ